MKKILYKYPKIRQYKDIVKEFKEDFEKKVLNGTCTEDSKLEILKFTGTIKLHGTNAAIVNTHDGDLYLQSRSMTIPIGDETGHMGFAKYIKSHEFFYEKYFKTLRKKLDVYFSDYNLVLYGEWCGKGIQKNVAINKVEKMFVVFDIGIVSRFDQTGESLEFLDFDFEKTKKLVENSPENNFYSINNFKTFEIIVDFNNPKDCLEDLIKYTNEVNDQCPVGEFFNVKGFGEGIVWRSFKNKIIRFKTKGENHAKNSSKPKQLKIPLTSEVVKNIKEFVDLSVTQQRLEQGLHEVFFVNGKEPCLKNIGEFFKWINQDIEKEFSDVLEKNDLKFKDVSREVTFKSKTWFFEQLKNYEIV